MAFFRVRHQSIVRFYGRCKSMAEMDLKKSYDNRKEEVIDACLGIFIQQGLSETSVRDLSKSIHLQSAGIYSYFPTKYKAVVACAEEAALRIEKEMIMFTVREITNDPDKLINQLFERAEKNAPTMRFLIQVFTTPKYSEQLEPIVNKLVSRYDYYTSRCAEKLGVDCSEFAPYFYIGLSAYMDYMILGSKEAVLPQIKVIQRYLECVKNQKAKMVINDER